ncbi:RTA1 domain-containing protein [Colletotrichum tabaci]|uniref:RTA1 domain-containing protein n=1 Tax=Colletotrichum tabaci TaxID=1209068 RepID=A0AAV9TM26_9PEZI
MAGSGVPILGSLYVYAPNKAAPIFFTIVYAISAAVHVWQCHHYKAWKLIGLHPFCALLFTLGYALREYGAYNFMYLATDKTPMVLFILSQICIFIGPPLLELANYHVLGRIFHYVPSAAPFNPARVTTFFGGLMALVEGLNAAGVALSANAKAKDASKKAGHNLILVALALQVAVVLVFAYLSATFHRRCLNARVPAQTKAVQSTLTTLYLSMTLILVRCLFRLVENSMGATSVDLRSMEALLSLSPVLRYESYFYVFEASLMFANSVLWNVRHPGPHLPQNPHIYLAQDGTEVEREVDGDERRPLLLRMANTLMFGLLIRDNKSDLHRQPQELSESTGSGSHGKPRGQAT